MFDNEDADQLSSHAFTFSYKLQLTSPPSTRQSPPSRTRAVDRDLSCEMRRQFRTLKAAL